MGCVAFGASTGFTRRGFVAATTALAGAVWLLLALAPALAQAHQDYIVCDNTHAPDYPTVSAHPHNCNLGLAQSYYQAQPVTGRSFAALALRQLHWEGWGGQEASAHGLSCSVRDNGSAVRGTCDHVEVNVYRPESVLPAGGVFIYQRIRVLHRRTRAEPYRYGYWYQPGTDY